jgi:hypothetical protein
MIYIENVALSIIKTILNKNTIANKFNIKYPFIHPYNKSEIILIENIY